MICLCNFIINLQPRTHVVLQPHRINRRSNLNPFILSETHCGAAAAVVAAGDRLCLVIKGTFWTFSLKELKKWKPPSPLFHHAIWCRINEGCAQRIRFKAPWKGAECQVIASPAVRQQWAGVPVLLPRRVSLDQHLWNSSCPVKMLGQN